jgi:putative acetyltransferase
MIKLIKAKTDKEILTIRKLFLEYAKSLDFELCFQDFDKELDELPGEYAEPHGMLLLAESDSVASAPRADTRSRRLRPGKTAGCVALRKIDREACEMKRLYVKPEFRGKKIGLLLAKKIIEEAKKIGYRKMRLDTTPQMKKAIELYKSLGFKEIKPYRFNPIEGAIYMEKKL